MIIFFAGTKEAALFRIVFTLHSFDTQQNIIEYILCAITILDAEQKRKPAHLPSWHLKYSGEIKTKLDNKHPDKTY